MYTYSIENCFYFDRLYDLANHKFKFKAISQQLVTSKHQIYFKKHLTVNINSHYC